MSRRERNAKAEDYFKRAPNYSAEAIPSLMKFSEECRVRYPVASHITRVLAGALEQSHKFALPIGGRVFDGELTESMIEAFRIPFPTCSFEFDAVKDGPEDKFRIARVPRRIALCIDSNEFLSRMANGKLSFPPPAEGSCVVWPIDDREASGWVPSWTGVTIPYMQVPVKTTAEEVSAIARLRDSLGIPWPDAKARKFSWRARHIELGDLGAEVLRSRTRDEAGFSAHVDTIDEMVAVIQACAAMECTNVTTEVIRPNREARAARPASTLFDYHVLMIDPGAERHPSEDRGGTHASPRTHLRRGHIRRLAWGPRIWVNSCVVNPGAIGTVNKDYAVKGTR